MKTSLKHIALFVTGGLIYNVLELLWRGWSHWTMFFLGGFCFIALGLINEIMPWTMSLWKQVAIGVCIIIILEFLTGCIVNLWLGWKIWDYSNLPGNILGQICPQYIILWTPVALAGIILDDWLRYWWWNEEKPHYYLF